MEKTLGPYSKNLLLKINICFIVIQHRFYGRKALEEWRRETFILDGIYALEYIKY